MLQIYELVNTVFTESIRDIHEGTIHSNEESVENIINDNLYRCEALRKYANVELAKISVMYSQSVAFIRTDYYTSTRKYSKQDLIAT